jgi:chromosome segregation ATPase
MDDNKQSLPDDDLNQVEEVSEPTQPEVLDSLPTDTTDQSGAAVVLNLEGLIKNHISQIEKLNEEYTKYKEMLDDIFANDETYQTHLEAAKEATRIKTATKQQILKQPQAADLNEKVKSLKSQVKELDGALSDYLGEYNRLSGINEIEGEDGQLREIVYIAKLVKKGAFRP